MDFSSPRRVADFVLVTAGYTSCPTSSCISALAVFAGAPTSGRNPSKDPAMANPAAYTYRFSNHPWPRPSGVESGQATIWQRPPDSRCRRRLGRRACVAKTLGYD